MKQEEKDRKDFMANLSKPAQNALAAKKITTLKKLSAFGEKEILALHGIGRSAMPFLKNELQKAGLNFRKHDPAAVDEYILMQQTDIQPLLRKMRQTVLKAVPTATEEMAYGMPAYKHLGKPLFYFAAAKNHIGIYATPSAQAAYAEELKGFKSGKGSVQLPFDKKIPWGLLKKMVAFKKAEIDKLANTSA